MLGNLSLIEPSLFSHPSFPRELVDQKIYDEIESLRKKRFFYEYNPKNDARSFGKSLTTGHLRGGSNKARAVGMAWCARLLAQTEIAEQLLRDSELLSSTPEAKIAKAFVLVHKKKYEDAFRSLEKLGGGPACTAALMIAAVKDGDIAALKWMESCFFERGDLDSDGKAYLLSLQLSAKNWEDAIASKDKFTDSELDTSPILHLNLASTYLLESIPDELRYDALQGVPLNAARFPFKIESNTKLSLANALKHFESAREVSNQLSLHETSALADEYALWISLRDSRGRQKSLETLANLLRDKGRALRAVPLAIQFGVELDLPAVDALIQHHIKLEGTTKINAARARFAIAMARKTPGEVASYIERYYSELCEFLSSIAIRSIQVEMWVQSGSLSRAKESLTRAREEGLSGSDESRMCRIISEIDGSDTLEVRLLQFEESNNLHDLSLLIEALCLNAEWLRACDFADELFRRTLSLEDGERLCQILFNAQRSDRIVDIFCRKTEIREQSIPIQISYCWALFSEGDLITSQSEIRKCETEKDNPSYRALLLKLAIGLGNWTAIPALLTREFENRESCTSQELLLAAHIGLRAGSPHVKDFLISATSKANGDARVFASAYFIAANAGWESEAEIANWIHAAAELSDETGPIQRATFKDIVEMRPDWERLQRDVSSMLTTGDIPFYLAANQTGKSLLELTIFQYFINIRTRDPRKRSRIPLFSGNRSACSIPENSVVGIEATALLTLIHLNILDEAFAFFTKVYLAHSTLSWIFDEKHRIAFHQPSRIKHARSFLEMVAIGEITPLTHCVNYSSILASKVGDNLALLIAIASAPEKHEEPPQKIVVRSNPVHIVGSLMEEKANLSEFERIICSCGAIVDKLVEMGLLSFETAKRSHSYLQTQEHPWPNEPGILEGAHLFLDGLSITYFRHLNILDKLSAAGFKLFVTAQEITEAKQLVRYESISVESEAIIDRLREALQKGLESGKIHYDREPPPPLEPDPQSAEHPTLGVFAMAVRCDVVISDDRFLNKHSNVGQDGNTTPIATSIDLLRHLTKRKIITQYQSIDCFTLLRRSGICFIQFDADDLLIQLKNSSIKSGMVRETAELRLIRESIQCVKMSGILQAPSEAKWLEHTFRALLTTIKKLWTESDSSYEYTRVRARCNWIFDLFEMRGWGKQTLTDPEERSSSSRVSNVGALLINELPIKNSRRDDYWCWLDADVLTPIKKYDPDAYESLVQLSKSQIIDAVNEGTKILHTNQSDNDEYITQSVAELALQMMPPVVRDSILEDDEFPSRFGLILRTSAYLGDSGNCFFESELHDAFRTLESGIHDDIILTDGSGIEWKAIKANGDDGGHVLQLSNEGRIFTVTGMALISATAKLRLSHLDKTAIETNLSRDITETWRSILKSRPATCNELRRWSEDTLHTPRSIGAEIFQRAKNGALNGDLLTPNNRSYYTQLVGAPNESASIEEFAKSSWRSQNRLVSDWHDYDGFLQNLYASGHASIAREVSTKRLSSEDIEKAFKFLLFNGDHISKLAAIEIGMRILPANPNLAVIIIELINQLRHENTTSPDAGFVVFSNLFIMVDEFLSTRRLFKDAPPFYRRLASIAQASLIQRQLNLARVDLKQTVASIKNKGNVRFYCQSLVDLRIEPRWLPVFSSPNQMKSEFLGRIIISARRYEENIISTAVHDLVFGKTSSSLMSQCPAPHPYIHGPLEGGMKGNSVMPRACKEMIEVDLKTDKISASSFTTLINASLLYQIDEKHVALVSEILEAEYLQILDHSDSHDISSMLSGLASICAAIGNYQLHIQVNAFILRYRFENPKVLKVGDSVNVLLMSCAANNAFDKWCSAVSDWITEMAFGELTQHECSEFLIYLEILLEIEPRLWGLCGRAHAALKSFDSI